MPSRKAKADRQPARPKPTKPKADKATAALRVEDLLRLRLAGAAWHEMRDYVRAQEQVAGSPWHLLPDAKPLSDGQLRRYLQRTDRLLEATLERDRKKLLNLHIAQRRSLLSRCLAQNDFSNARGVLKDEAELLGLYPQKKTTVKGRVGGRPVVLNIVEEVVGPGTGQASGEAVALPAIAEEIVTATPTPNPEGRPAA